MSIKTFFSDENRHSIDKKVFSLLSTFIIVIGFFVAAGILFPTTVSIFLNILWTILIAIVVIFFALGALVIFGMRKEASRVLDVLLEGSLSFLDFLEFIKSVWKRFIEMVKEFLVFAAPFFAYILTLLIYVLLIVIYKTVGKNNDVTIMTVAITVGSLVLFGIVSKPQTTPPDNTKWFVMFKTRLRAGFIDAFEVVLFIFFLTMDSTHIFFLPPDLNVPLRAQWGDYDLMVRSFHYTNHMKITINLINFTILLEIIRNSIRVFAFARQYYMSALNEPDIEESHKTLQILKDSLRQAFYASKDDLIKFITFNTVLFLVFLFFPRLKLLTLIFAAATNLCMDLIIRSRLYSQKGSDLISRLITKIFRLA